MKRRADKAKKVKGQRIPHNYLEMHHPGPPCFVCGEVISGQGISLLVGYTSHSNTGLPTKIGQLMGDGFMVVVNTEDVLCKRCTALLNHLDKLEVDLDSVKSCLMNYLKMKYQLLDEFEEDDVVNQEDPKIANGNLDIVNIKTEDDGSGSEWENEGSTKKVNVEIILDENHSQRRNFTCYSPESERPCPFECENCGFATNDLTEFQQHPSVCLNFQLECKICGNKFDSSKNVQDHILQTHLSKWVCHLCSTNFAEEQDFITHMHIHIKDKNEEDCNLKNSLGNYECNMCDFQCDDKIIYDDHIRNHVILKLFKCKECGKRYGDEISLNKHRSLHINVKKCDLCSLLCSNEDDLLKHMKDHQNSLNLLCDDEMTWTSREQLLQNEETLDIEKTVGNNSEEDSQKEVRFPSCAICSLSFLNATLYEQHMKTHSAVELPSRSKDNMDADNSLISSLVDSQNYVGSAIDGNLEDIFEKIKSGSQIASTENKSTDFVSNVSENDSDVFKCDISSDILEVDKEATMNNDSHCSVEELNITNPSIRKCVTSPLSLKNSESSTLSAMDSKSIIDVKDNYLNHFTIHNEENLITSESTNNSDIFKGKKYSVEGATKSSIFQNIYTQLALKKSPDSSEGSNSFHEAQNTQNLERMEFLHENQPKLNASVACDGKPAVKKTFVCGECGYRCSDIVELKEHFKVHQSSKVHKCTLCSKTFISKQRLIKHFKAHKNSVVGKMTCPTCYKDFPDYLNLFQHMQDQHQREKAVYKCELCSKKFTSRKAFKAHEEEHPEKFGIKCDECGQTFMKEKQLKDHKDASHRDPHCRYCGKEIMKLKTLRNHELRHLRDKDNFECDVCKRVFKTKTGLRHHVAVHTGEYKYCCDYCGRGFMSRMMMEEHRSMHTKEERYVCDVCGRKFSFQSTYWIHRKWHDNPYPYKCTFCNRMFRHSSLLAVHKRKHTGERPYQCPHCPLSFPVGGTLKRHLILHTGVYPFNCDSCKRGFTTRHKYATHLAKVHGDYDLLNAKQPQGEYKMVVRDEPKYGEDASLWSVPDENEQNEINFKFEVSSATTTNTGNVMDQMDTGIPCSVVPDDMLVDSSIAARVVEIVLDDESQAVATVTLAEPGPSILPELWYQ